MPNPSEIARRDIEKRYRLGLMTFCANCDTETGGTELCPSCEWLSKRGKPNPDLIGQRGGAEERLVNRRWQMRYARGDLKE